MAEPKKKLSHSRSGNRRSHLADQIKNVNLAICEKCKHQIKPHFVCPNCGFYRGKTVLNIK
jgi:large subunit ribosomal protein L32